MKIPSSPGMGIIINTGLSINALIMPRDLTKPWIIGSLPDIDLRKSCCSLGLGVKRVLRVGEPFLTRISVTLLTGRILVKPRHLR